MRPPNRPPDPDDGYLVPRQPARGPAPAEREPSYGYGYDDYEEPGGGLLDYWRILKRRKGTLVLVTFFGGLLALLLTLPQTPIYQTHTSLEIQQLNPQFMDMGQMNPIQESASWKNNDIDTQIQILKSDTLIRRTLTKLGWTKPTGKPSEGTGRVSSWRRALNLPGEKDRSPRLRALDMAADHLKVRAQGQTRIVEILVDSTNPEIAAAFANTLTNEYIEQNMESRWQMTQRTGKWLTRQIETMKIKLEHSEQQLNDYATRAGLMYTDAQNQQGSVAEEKLSQLQQALSDAHADRVSKQSRYELIRTSPVDALPDVLNDPTLRNYQTTLTDLRRQKAELSTTYTPSYSKIKRLEAQIEIVQGALQREREAIIRRIRNDYQEAGRREKLLQQDYGRQKRMVTDQTAKSVQYNILKREVDSNRQIYQTMLERVKSASVASALRASNVRVVDRAAAPVAPYKPRKALNTLLGLLLGGFFGVVFVIMRERADHSLQEPGDVNYYLSLPELGVIPAAEKDGKLRLLYHHHRHGKMISGSDSGASVTGDKEANEEDNALGNSVELVTWKRKPSALAESFRATLTSILFSGENGSRPRVITLTSAQPAEGKTTVASNLAIALAEVNRRVLLIDGDLRKPRLHEIFEITRENGLSDILKDNTPLDGNSLDGSVRATAIENLFLLPSGEVSHASTNLLYSERMSDLLERFEQEFDMVLIDTPPMLQIPDARILGRMSDAVILVVRAGKTTRDTAMVARQRFAEDGANVLGAILNYWDPKKSTNSSYRYNYYDRYYYRG